MSKEIREVLGYIERLYSFIHGVTYDSIYKHQDLSNCEMELLLNKIIYKRDEDQNMLEFDGEKQKFEHKIENNINVDIIFEEYKEFFSNVFIHLNGNLASKYFMIPEQKWVNVDFRPISDLIKYENDHKAMTIISMLFQALFLKRKD